ncbi:MAG: M20/M25/M40 family metallo-hydrolase [Tepidisphaeraceae bacterium]
MNRLRLAAALLLTSIVGCQSSHTTSSPPSTQPTTARALDLFGPPAAFDARTITNEVRRDVDWLASPQRQGRGPGTAGLDETADYIARRFESLQLQVVPGMSSYFQPFESGSIARVANGSILKTGVAELTRDSWHGQAWAAPGEFQGPLAFVGYAITTEDKDHPYDDFAGVDVKGKVVLAFRWEPHTADGKSRLTDDGAWSPEAQLQRKARRAADAGAVALLLVNPPEHHQDTPSLLPEEERGKATAPIPAFHLTQAGADELLRAANGPSVADLQKQIDESGKPASRVFASDVSGKLELTREKIAVKNVMAFLPGAGPTADEVVVVGAHCDHIGLGGPGSLARSSSLVHPGADDNASGTAALLALAKQFKHAGPQKRSILFVAFTLEEQGLIGSKYFVEHWPVPRERVVAMINLDMVGRVRNEMLFHGGSGTHPWFASILAGADERSPLKLLSIGKGGRGPSDHASFSKAGVPVLFLFSGLHSDYHRPTDTPDKVNAAGIAEVVRLTLDLVRGACAMSREQYVDRYDNQGVNVNVQSGASSADEPTSRSTTRRAGRRVQFGVEPDYVEDDTIKGLRIAGTVPGTAAREAGLQAGDILTSIDQQPVTDAGVLADILGRHKPGDVIHVVLQRDKQTVQVSVTLKARPGDE